MTYNEALSLITTVAALFAAYLHFFWKDPREKKTNHKD